MKRFFSVTAFIFLLCVIASVHAASDDEQAVLQVAKALAATTLLGSGSHHYVTSIVMLAGDSALAVIGEDDDTNAYKVHVQKNQKQWKITAYEYTFEPTGKVVIEIMKPPFPAPYWDKLIKETG